MKVLPVGDRALLVECAPGAGTVTADLVRSVPGVVETVPAAATVLAVVEHPRRLAGVREALQRLEEPAAGEPGTGEEVILDVVYDGEDLPVLASAAGMSVEGLVARHTAQVWTSAFIGFAPGFAYLAGTGGLPEVPRRAEPRTSVPAGSVALAGRWSAVYPTASPGGWQLLGRTDSVVWDPDRTPPALLVPGTRVRFRAVRAGRTAVAGAVPGYGSRREPTAGDDLVRQEGPGVDVVRTGPLALVEDLGRPGQLAVGVPRGGALDRGAAVRANRLVGNPRGAAVVEVTFGGLVLRAHSAQGADGDLVLAVTGAPAPLEVLAADVVVRPGLAQPFVLPAGAELWVGSPPTGVRTYVAVRGGFEAPTVLGSRSVDLLSGLARPLTAGDRLAVGRPNGDAVALVWEPDPGPAVPPDRADPSVRTHRVRVLPGPRADRLEPSGPRLTDRPWTVLDASNRVGLRLDGPPLRTVAGELASEGTVPGAVQVPPSGRPVVFLADHPVTGGYPVVAVVADADLDGLAQVRPGERVVLAGW